MTLHITPQMLEKVLANKSSSPLSLAMEFAQEELQADDDALTNAHYGKSLIAYAQAVKPDYDPQWFHLEIASALEKLYYGKITRLFIMMPPRHGKSELVTRLFPSWVLGHNSHEQIVACSYSSDLIESMGRDAQNYMNSQMYQTMFSTKLASNAPVYYNRRGRVVKRKLKETNSLFEVANGQGYFLGSGVDGGITGRGMTLGIIDDPVKNREEANSARIQDKNSRWYTSTYATRGEGGFSMGGEERIVVCMTPWAQMDLGGQLLRNEEDWVVLRYSAFKEDDSDYNGRYKSTPGYSLDLREIGEPLWEKKFSKKKLEVIRKRNEFDWQSLYQCKPPSIKGNIFKRNLIQRYPEKWYQELAKANRPRLYYTVDCAFKDNPTGSKVCFQLWAKIGADHFLRDFWWGLFDWIETRQLALKLFAQQKAHGYLIEDKANGTALIAEVKKAKFTGVVPIEPVGDKVMRAIDVLPTFLARNVWFPERHVNIDEAIEEVTTFPGGPRDDFVDAMTQYLDNSAIDPVQFYKEFTKS